VLQPAEEESQTLWAIVVIGLNKTSKVIRR
jgi:hypothetical protein